jgi:hypothetical protein
LGNASKISVERWSRLSIGSVAAAVALILILSAGPLFFGAGVIDKLTTLFIYIILAVTLNALAGYGGLVSIGQQAFFGLGAYGAVRLAECGRQRLLRAGAPPQFSSDSSRCQFRPSCCASGAASSRSECGSSPYSLICSSISTRWCGVKPGPRC